MDWLRNTLLYTIPGYWMVVMAYWHTSALLRFAGKSLGCSCLLALAWFWFPAASPETEALFWPWSGWGLVLEWTLGGAVCYCAFWLAWRCTRVLLQICFILVAALGFAIYGLLALLIAVVYSVFKLEGNSAEKILGDAFDFCGQYWRVAFSKLG